MKFEELPITYGGKYPQNAFLYKIISRMGVRFPSATAKMTLKKTIENLSKVDTFL